MRHPADGPRLNTLYVPRSQRIRRRSSNARRRVRVVVLGIVAVILVLAAAVVYRDPLIRQGKRLITRARPQSPVRDVNATPQFIPTLPSAPPGPPRP